MSNSPHRPTALVRAEHHAPVVRLSRAETRLLNEALRRGEDLREQMETSVTGYGRWLLGNVFDDDAAAALDDRTKNAVWIELVRRAGGPTLGVSRRMLYTAVAIAANDRRIADQSWRGLDSARKELLLPLRERARMRDAAQHVSKFNLSQTRTREYVTHVLAGGGRTRQSRLTAKGLASRVRTLRESLAGAPILRQVEKFRLDLARDERAKLVGELEALSALLAELTSSLRSRRGHRGA